MQRKTMNKLVLTAAVAAMVATGAPLRASEADDKIESSFKQTHVSKTYLKDDAISASAKDGVVTLTGTVADESNKALAQETVAGLPGVTRVDNRLVTKAEASVQNADMWIGRKVKLNLFFHRSVSASTTVDVKDGVVTLKGEASNAAQKDLTGQYAGDIEGVKSVKNEMTIAAMPAAAERTTGEKLDDASITAQVKMVLASHRATSAIKTGVVTRDGEVTLTGIASNAAEKALVSKMVGDIQGVTTVNNQMTITVAMAK